MGEMQMNPERIRELKTEDGKYPDEARIASELIKGSQIYSHNGKSYTPDGELSIGEFRNAVANLLIQIGFKTGIARKTDAIIELIKMLSNVDYIPVEEDEIPVQNGTVYIAKDGTHSYGEEKHLSPYRLKCSYDPEAKEITHFQNWLDDLLTSEDQICFQEIMGYLLLPSTRAQKAFFLLGTGGEGKSIWGTILAAMFGDGFTPTKIYELEENRFTIATIENKVIAYDDDMNHDKLKKTDNFKTIVSAKIPIQGERKGRDKFEFLPYARICACGNFALSSLYDTSDGFFRRLLPIRVKNRSAGRRDVSDYERTIFPELDAVFMWSLEGLRRLIENDYKFSVSDRSNELLSDIREESNSIIRFMEAELIFEKGAKVTSDELYSAYSLFCNKHGDVPRGRKSVPQYFKDREELLNIRYAKRVRGDKRGFVGMRLKSGRFDLDSILGKGDAG